MHLAFWAAAGSALAAAGLVYLRYPNKANEPAPISEPAPTTAT